MGNEEIEASNKKASKDKLVTFLSIHFWISLIILSLSLSLFLSLSLSLLDTQIFLGALWHWIKKGKEGKRNQRSSNERQDQADTVGFFAGIDLHVHFPCQIWHAQYCIWIFCSYGMGYARCNSVFIIALPFPNSHGVIGFSCFS